MMKKRDYIFILLGTSLMAAAINLVYAPMDMVTGGVSGLAIILKNITEKVVGYGIPIWLTNAVVNIPLLITACYMKGKKFIIKTLYATVCFTIALSFIPSYSIIGEDYVLAALSGGIITGTGLGLVFLTGSSTGGTDLLGSLLQCHFRYYSIAQLLMMIDSIIVLIGAVVFGIHSALYAVAAVYITSKVTDGILEGLKFGKIAFVISNHADEIAAEILEHMNRGVTSLSAKGMYSNTQKRMLFCVVSKKETVRLMDIVNKADEKAFVIVTDAREVLGEGFVQNAQQVDGK